MVFFDVSCHVWVQHVACVVSLCDEALHRDLFVATVGLMRQYFSQCHTAAPSLLPLEQALRRGDYGAYRLYGRCFLCV